MHPLDRRRLLFNMMEDAQLFHNSRTIGQNGHGGANRRMNLDMLLQNHVVNSGAMKTMGQGETRDRGPDDNNFE